MDLKVCLGCILLCLHLSSGAVIPLAKTELYTMVNNFIAILQTSSNPANVACANCLSRVDRVKRGAGVNDKGFSFRAAGVEVDLRYHDEYTKARGGNFSLSMNEFALGELFRGMGGRNGPGITNVKLSADFDKGTDFEKNFDDELFTFEVKYEIESNRLNGLKFIEKSSLIISRVFDGEKWITTIKPPRRLPDFIPYFSIILESDHTTFLNAKVSSDESEYNLNIKFSPFKKIEATLMNGKDTIFEVLGDLDMASKKLVLQYDLYGEKLSADVSFDGTSDEKVQLKADVKPPKGYFLSPSARLFVYIHADKYLTDAGISISMRLAEREETMYAVNLKGTIAQDNKYVLNKYVLKYDLQSIGIGELRFSFEDMEVEMSKTPPEKLADRKIVLEFLMPRDRDYPLYKIALGHQSVAHGLTEMMTIDLTHYGNVFFSSVSNMTSYWNTQSDQGMHFSTKMNLRTDPRRSQEFESRGKITWDKSTSSPSILFLEFLEAGVQKSRFKIITGHENIYEIDIYDPYLLPQMFDYLIHDVAAIKMKAGEVAGGQGGWEILFSLQDDEEIEFLGLTALYNGKILTVAIPVAYDPKQDLTILFDDKMIKVTVPLYTLNGKLYTLNGKLDYHFSSDINYIKIRLVDEVGLEHNFDANWDFKGDTYKVVSSGRLSDFYGHVNYPPVPYRLSQNMYSGQPEGIM